MKNIVIVIGVLFLMTGCIDEDINKNNEPPHLSITAMKEYIPQNYKNKNDVIFVNEAGSELRLKVNWMEVTEEKKEHGITYTADKFDATLRDANNVSFQITLSGTANYATSGTSSIVRSLAGILMPFNPSGTTWAMLNFENGVPKISLGDDFR